MKKLLLILICLFVFGDAKSEQFTIYCEMNKHLQYDHKEQKEVSNKVVSLKRTFLIDSGRKMFITSDFLSYFKIEEVTQFKYLDSVIYRKIDRRNDNKEGFLEELNLNRVTGEIKQYQRNTGTGPGILNADFSNTWYGICEIIKKMI